IRCSERRTVPGAVPFLDKSADGVRENAALRLRASAAAAVFDDFQICRQAYRSFLPSWHTRCLAPFVRPQRGFWGIQARPQNGDASQASPFWATVCPTLNQYRGAPPAI